VASCAALRSPDDRLLREIRCALFGRAAFTGASADATRAPTGRAFSVYNSIQPDRTAVLPDTTRPIPPNSVGGVARAPPPSRSVESIPWPGYSVTDRQPYRAGCTRGPVRSAPRGQSPPSSSSSSHSPPHFWQPRGSQCCFSQHPFRQSSQHFEQRCSHTVAAITSSVFTGSVGSSLVITSSHDLGSRSVAM